MEINLREFKPLSLFVILIIVLLSVQDVFLILQNQHLKSIINRAGSGKNSFLKSGDLLKSINIQSKNGAIKKLEYNDASVNYLLFIFSTTCPHCEKNIMKWETISKNNNNPSLNIFGISLQDIQITNTWAINHNINFLYFSAVDKKFKKIYKISGVPLTLSINGKGVVQNIWIGELDSNQVSEINTKIMLLAGALKNN